MAPPSAQSSLFALSLWLLGVLGAAAGGCSGQGTLRCGDGPCPQAEPTWIGGRDLAGVELPDLAVATPDQGGGPSDQGPPLPDLQQPPRGDLAPQLDLGGGSCAPGPWPRDQRAERDSSGGSGGALGIQELPLAGDGPATTVLLHVPDCPVPGGVYGLVVALHDADGDREYLRFKWAEAARDWGYVVALPLAQRGYVGERNWLERGDEHRKTVRDAVELAEQLYPIDRKDTVLTGLGVGATFANDVAAADEEGLYEHLLLVNGTLWDPSLEGRHIKSFIVLGQSPSPSLATHPSSPYFRYLYAPVLGSGYPGPPDPRRAGDPALSAGDPLSALAWFWP